MMSSTIKYLFLLTCINLCASYPIGCRCVRKAKSVKVALIADIREYPVRPYCNTREVIVKLKDGNLRCLDPEHKFTQAVLQAREQWLANRMRFTTSAGVTAQHNISSSHNTTTNKPTAQAPTKLVTRS